MAEDLLDLWVKLITPIFPPNAWIDSRFSKDDYVILIDWQLVSDSRRQNKRSRKIQITIKEDAIEDYLDKNNQDRELFNVVLKQSICERYDRFNADNDISAIKSIPAETWLFSKRTLNTLANPV